MSAQAFLPTAHLPNRIEFYIKRPVCVIKAIISGGTRYPQLIGNFAQIINRIGSAYQGTGHVGQIDQLNWTIAEEGNHHCRAQRR